MQDEQKTCITHSYTFNTDGFEVCITCGLCSGSQNMIHNDNDYDQFEFQQNSTDFSYILENSHIGYVSEVNEEYRNIKSVLKRGYPNVVLYAYCTYKILRANSIFYPISHISKMFRLKNFSKYFSLIEKNSKIDKSLHFFTFDQLESSVRIFLCKFEYMNHYKQAFIISKFVFKRNSKLKPVFQVAIVLYFILYSKYKIKQNLIGLLSEHFSINQRTLKKKINIFFTSLVQHQRNTPPTCSPAP